MAPLTGRRLTPERADNDWHHPVAADTVIQDGSLVVLDAGFAKPGEEDDGLIAAGRAQERVDNSGGAAGDKLIKVRRGIFRWANSASGDEITAADVGTLAYVVDDQTVARTSDDGGRSIAGLIEEVEADGVWVRTDLAIGRLGADHAALADVVAGLD